MYRNINKIRVLLICATIGCGVVLCIYYSIRFMRDDIYISVWKTDSSSLRKIFPFDFEPISSYWVLKQITPGGILPGPSTIQKWGIVNITEQSADELRKKYIWKPYHGNRPLAEIPDFDVKKIGSSQMISSTGPDLILEVELFYCMKIQFISFGNIINWISLRAYP